MSVDVRIEASWKTVLKTEFEKDYFLRLREFIREEYIRADQGGTPVFPAKGEIFKAFDACPFDRTRVVILGQDPYHGPGQAHGLCFSVKNGVRFPPSLRNIFKEALDDVGKLVPQTGDLSHWSDQGVLLLNAVLTVRAGQAASHSGKGWESFTDAAIRCLAEQKSHLVFILWGAYAQKKGAFIDESRHLVIRSAHPSPLSAHNGFFGSKPFSRTNAFLKSHGFEPVQW